MKNLHPDIQKASTYITDRFSDDKNVVAILLVGSAAREAMDDFSDIDFYVLLSEQGEHPVQEQIDDVAEHQVEVLYDTISDVTTYLKNEDGALYRNVSSMLSNGLILYSANKEQIEDMQKIAKKNLESKLELSSEAKNQYSSSVKDFLSDMQRSLSSHDSVGFLLNSKQCLDSLMPLIAECAGTYMRKPNLLASYLHNQAPDLHKALQKVSESKTDKEKLESLKYIFSRIC